MANGEVPRELIADFLISKRDFWIFLSKKDKRKYFSVVDLLRDSAIRYLREEGVDISSLRSKYNSLQKYKRLIKSIDFSERGTKKEQALEEHKVLMEVRPFARESSTIELTKEE